MFLLNLFVLKNYQSSVYVILTCTCHIAAIFGYDSVILLLGFTSSEMLHGCTEAFLVQSFFNLIIEGNTIVVCSFPVPCLMPWQIVFSKLVDSVIASLLFRSLFYHLSRVLREPGMHMCIVNKVWLIVY